MSKHGFYGKFTTHTGQRDALAQILLEAAGQMQEVEGCELYTVSIVENEPETVWVTEVWRDAAAHKASFTLEGTKTLIERGRPLIAGMESIKLLTLGGKGLQ